MAKGGYRGGGTIIGPQTPDWFTWDAKEHPKAAANPPTPTATDYARIEKLVREIKFDDAERRRAEASLASHRAALIELLTKFGLPLDRWPETGSRP